MLRQVRCNPKPLLGYLGNTTKRATQDHQRRQTGAANCGVWHVAHAYIIQYTEREHKISWVFIIEPMSIPMYILSLPCLRSVCKAFKTGGKKSKISITVLSSHQFL